MDKLQFLVLIIIISVTVSRIIAKFHYTGPTGPDLTRTDFFAARVSPRNFVGSVRVSECQRDAE